MLGTVEPAVNTDGRFMACPMLVYFNEENTLEQQGNFVLYSTGCNSEIKVTLCPGILSLCTVQCIPTLAEVYLLKRAH